MKKSIVILAALVSSLWAIGLEITPFGGFQWNGYNEFGWYEGVQYYNGKIDLEHFGNYGVFINIDMPARGTELELSWTGCATEASWRAWSLNGSQHPNYPNQRFDVYSNYWHIGTLKHFGPSDGMIAPYVNTSVGATLFSAKDNVIKDQWFFSVAGGLGTKINITDKIGIRLGGRFLVPINFSGVGISFGSGGSSVGAYGRVPILQGDVHGGIVIKLGGGQKQAKPAQKAAPAKQQPAQTAPTTRVEEVSDTEVHLIHE